MKKYLIDFFNYNSWANSKLLEIILQLPDKQESLKLFQHFINTQDKWMNRITKETDDKSFPWFSEAMPADELNGKWKASVNQWINYLENISEVELEKEVHFSRVSDGKKLCVKLIDLMLQLNYHSIHHRAQINKIIRFQGLNPPATDYIFTVLKEA